MAPNQPKTEMKYAIVPLEELKAADYNPRVTLQPGDEDYEQIKASLAEFSQVLPIVFNERTNRIVGGHQRVNILAEQGYNSALVVYVDVSEEEEKLLNIGLNRIGEREAMWNRDALEYAISDIDDALLTITGFTREVDEDVSTPDPDTLSKNARCGWGDFTAEVDPDVVGEVVGMLEATAAVQQIEPEGVLDLLLNEMMEGP